MSIEVTTDLNLVDTAQIVDGSVTSAKIADNAVVASKISAGAVGTAAISSGAATSGQILQANGSGAVTFATPATGAVTLISSSTVSTATQTVTLSSIPQGYQSLRLVIRDLYSSTTTANRMDIYINDIRTNTYGWQRVTGASTTASAQRGTDIAYMAPITVDWLPASSNLVGTFATIDFYNYANTTKAKFGGGAVFYQATATNTFTNVTQFGFMEPGTAAITSLVFYSSSATNLIGVGSRFDLYGVS